MLEHVPIRWRLAIVSAALTFVILAGFAVVIGQVTASRVRATGPPIGDHRIEAG